MKAYHLGLLAMVVSLTVAPRADAQTIFNWNAPAPGNGNFGAQLFWTPTGPPGTTGEARFNSANSTYTITFTTDPTNFRARIGDDHVTFNLDGHTYTLTTTSTSVPSIMVGGITFVDDALLTLTNGTLAGQHAVIAPAIFQTAAGMVVDSGATLDLAGTFTIGKQLPGSLTIQSGGDVLSATGVLGESGAGDGTVTVTGLGSTWTNSGSVFVGGQAGLDGGNGTLSITNQGLVDIGGALKLWLGGNVALDGGTLETAVLELAGGSFNLTSGTLHTQTLEIAGGSFNWTSGTLHLGSDLILDPSGLLGGSLTVGAGKVLLADSDLYVGNAGNGTLDITDGGRVLRGDAFNESIIGLNNGATGEVTVAGGSEWSTSRVTVGNGSLDISNGQVLTGQLLIGSGAGSIGVVIVDGPTSRILIDKPLIGVELNVGSLGNGSLEIRNGGDVDATYGSIGDASINSSGSLIVDGPGSRCSARQLVIAGFVSVTNGGTLSVVTSVSIDPLGELYAEGTIEGSVENAGLLAPGSSPGVLEVVGDYTQTTDGELKIELASASYDQLLVTGNATLAGTLTVNLLDGFIPGIGQIYTFLTAADVDSEFDVEPLSPIPGIGFDVMYNAQSVVLTILSAVPGDYNGNGKIDAADYTSWRDAMTAGSTSLTNDPTPGVVDETDFDYWRAHFGETLGTGAGSASSAAVPEPSTISILLTASLAILGRRARQFHQLVRM